MPVRAWLWIERFHAGNYSCRAVNAAGTDLYTAHLSVNGRYFSLPSFSRPSRTFYNADRVIAVPEIAQIDSALSRTALNLTQHCPRQHSA